MTRGYAKNLEIGQKINYWTVLDQKYSGRGCATGSRGSRRKYLCQCDCGTLREVWKSHLSAGLSKSCGCIHRVIGPDHPNWGGCGEISGNYWNNLSRNAKGKRGRSAIGISINIKYAWDLFLKQNRRCALSDIELTFYPDQNASVDRIDSSVGYHEGNVQWVHKDINIMKNVFEQEHFIEMCKRVSYKSDGDVCDIDPLAAKK